MSSGGAVMGHAVTSPNVLEVAVCPVRDKACILCHTKIVWRLALCRYCSMRASDESYYLSTIIVNALSISVYIRRSEPAPARGALSHPLSQGGPY